MERQQKYDDLLCMRPTERSGLPIVTLHPAFRNYRQRLRSKTLVPPDSVALQVAGALCEVMGGYFQDKKARGEKFDQCVEPLLPSWRNTVVTSKSEQTQAEPDRTLDSHGGHRRLFWLSIREDKVELGEAGDAYMQNSRDYHLYVKSLQEDPNFESVNFLKHGAPMFLLALIGRCTGNLLTLTSLMVYRPYTLCFRCLLRWLRLRSGTTRPHTLDAQGLLWRSRGFAGRDVAGFE